MGKGAGLALLVFASVAFYMMSQSSGGSSGGATFSYQGFAVTMSPGGIDGVVTASWKYKTANGVVVPADVSADNVVDATTLAHSAIDYIVSTGGSPA